MFGKILKFVSDTEFVYLPYWYSSEKMINLNWYINQESVDYLVN